MSWLGAPGFRRASWPGALEAPAKDVAAAERGRATGRWGRHVVVVAEELTPQPHGKHPLSERPGWARKETQAYHPCEAHPLIPLQPPRPAMAASRLRR